MICPAHFKSGMFAGFMSGIPEFLAPSLEVDTVAELVEKTILSGESQVSVPRCRPLLLVPRSAALSPGARGGALGTSVRLTLISIAQHIIEPYYASFTPLGRALPTWIYGGILAYVPTLHLFHILSVKSPCSHCLGMR